MQVDVVNMSGQKVSSLTLPGEIFDRKVSPSLMAQAVRVYTEHLHRGTRKTKHRGEVARTTAKVWRQKGTGRARHGSRKAPIFVGGGIAHGPRGVTAASLKLTKKMRRLALFGALTDKVSERAMIAVNDLTRLLPKTREAYTFLQKVGVEMPTKRVLLVVDKPYENVGLAVRNLANVSLAQARQLDFYQVLMAWKVMMTPASVEVLKETFLPGKKREGQEKKVGVEQVDSALVTKFTKASRVKITTGGQSRQGTGEKGKMAIGKKISD